MNYATIKRNFDKGLWNLNMVRMAVRKGVISKQEFKDITGQDY